MNIGVSMFCLSQISRRMMLALICFNIITHQIYAEPTEDVFTDLYNSSHWGSDENGGTSGEGSMLETTVEYREFLQDFLKTNQIQTVIDVGCGDWQFSRTLDWSGI